MTDGMKQYRRVLKRKPRCSWGVRKRLLEKFDDAAFSYLENEPTPALVEVTEAFGPPEEMARTLMEEVTPKEAATYKRGVIFRIVVACILLASVIAGAVWVWICKETHFTITPAYYEVMPDGSTVPVYPSTPDADVDTNADTDLEQER